MLAPIETKGPESRARKPIRPNLTGEMEFSRYRKKLVLANKLEEIEAMRHALMVQKEALERESQLGSQFGGSYGTQGGTLGGTNSLQKGSGSLASLKRMGSLTLLSSQEEPKKPLTREEKRLMRHSVAPAMSAKLDLSAKIEMNAKLELSAMLGLAAEEEGGDVSASVLPGGSSGQHRV